MPQSRLCDSANASAADQSIAHACTDVSRPSEAYWKGMDSIQLRFRAVAALKLQQQKFCKCA